MRFASCIVALVVVVTLGVAGACQPKTDVELWVDGFQPKNVRFEIEDKGPLAKADVDELAKRPDIDGALRLPDGTCPSPGCRVAIVSVFVHNMDPGAEAEPPPVVRLKAPAGKPQRLPIAFRGAEISKGRVGRIRWVVEMYPEEKTLVATISSSVMLVDVPSSTTNAPATNAPATNAPATNAPATNAPATNAPATNAPTTQAPTTTPGAGK